MLHRSADPHGHIETRGPQWSRTGPPEGCGVSSRAPRWPGIRPSPPPRASASCRTRSRFFLRPQPRPAATITEASSMAEPPQLPVRISSTTFVRIEDRERVTGVSTIRPRRPGSFFKGANTFGRTVAIWGRVYGETIEAITLPPKAGAGLNQLPLIIDGKTGAVGGQAQVEARGDPGGQVPTVGGGPAQKHRRPLPGDNGRQHTGETVGGIAVQQPMPADHDPVRTRGNQVFQSIRPPVPETGHRQRFLQPVGQHAAAAPPVRRPLFSASAGRLTVHTPPIPEPRHRRPVFPAKPFCVRSTGPVAGQPLTQAPHRVQLSPISTVLPASQMAPNGQAF